MVKHFVATAYIVSKIDKKYKVLLHKHKKLKIWIGIGGHIEKGENPIEAVIREIKEETNLEVKLKSREKLVITSDVRQLITPVAVIEEDIPKHKKVPEHKHIDSIFHAFCKNPNKIKMDEEYKWLSKNDLKKMKLKKEVKTIAGKILDMYAD